VCGVGRAIGIDRVIGIAVVGDDDCLIVVGLGGLDDLSHAIVDSPYGLGNGVIDTGMSHHVAIGEVHHDEVILLCVDGTDEFIFHLVCAHLGLQVVSGHLGRGHKDAVLALERSLATAIEEESDVRILLGLGGMELSETVLREIFAQGVLYVLLGEEHRDVLEVGVVGSHGEVVQVVDGVHTLVGEVLLGEHLRQLFGTVVAEVEEDHHVALAYRAIDRGIVDGLDKLIGHALGITFLHSLNHVGGLFAGSFHQQVIGFFHPVPPLVAVHRVESSDDAGDMRAVGRANLLHFLDESLAALGVGVAAIHEAVNVNIVQTIFLANLDELIQMVEARVHATV